MESKEIMEKIKHKYTECSSKHMAKKTTSSWAIDKKKAQKQNKAWYVWNKELGLHKAPTFEWYKGG